MDDDVKRLSQLLDVTNHQQVLEEVRIISLRILPSFDFRYVADAFRDVDILFRGEYPGYRACNTEYHDLTHTHEVFLAMSRLMHGAVVKGKRFTEKEVNIGLISALMHDTGYSQTIDDEQGTGAKYALTHIQRSIDFIHRYFVDHDYFGDSMQAYSDILNCTGLMTNIREIKFSSPKMALLGKMLGTADLLGQMSDRFYLEKLPFLYREFVEAGITAYANEVDLLDKTIGFRDMMQNRYVQELDSVNRFMIHHFKERHHIDRDLYQESIDRNIEYLKRLLTHNREDLLSFLKRGGMSKKYQEQLKIKP